MKLKVKLLNPKAEITKAHEDDAGFDLVAISETIVNLKEWGYIEYDLGLAVTPDPGYYCELRSRSSISKTGLWLANGIGTIDPNYTGSLKVRFKWIPGTKKYEVGDKVAQLVVLPLPKVELEMVEQLEQTDRSAGAFGSTDLKK